jgi:hypothetical protein
MKIQYIISIVILGLSAAAALLAYLLNAKKESKPKWIKPGVAAFTALFLASTVFLSAGAATNQLEKPKAAPVFDPSLNGYLENVKTPDGIYTGEFSAGHYEGKGKLIYNDGAVYDGRWKQSKREGQGEYISVEGWTYKGAWAGDMMNGIGLYTFKRGIATGNNNFFILKKNELKELELPREVFRPVLPNARYLNTDEIFAFLKLKC